MDFWKGCSKKNEKQIPYLNSAQKIRPICKFPALDHNFCTASLISDLTSPTMKKSRGSKVNFKLAYLWDNLYRAYIQTIDRSIIRSTNTLIAFGNTSRKTFVNAKRVLSSYELLCLWGTITIRPRSHVLSTSIELIYPLHHRTLSFFQTAFLCRRLQLSVHQSVMKIEWEVKEKKR